MSYGVNVAMTWSAAGVAAGDLGRRHRGRRERLGTVASTAHLSGQSTAPISGRRRGPAGRRLGRDQRSQRIASGPAAASSRPFDWSGIDKVYVLEPRRRGR